MKSRFMPLRGIGFVAAMAMAAQASAQPRTPPPVGMVAPPAASAVAIDPETIPMPELNFEPTPEIAGNFGKYHYFHRAGTDFQTAYADILECDGYSRGFTHTAAVGNPAVPAPYAGTLAGAVGGSIGMAIGAGIADAIWGSAERRRLRRVNMRSCMQFKGYHAYGLPERLWDRFNFTEGGHAADPAERARMLQIQARVASGPVPQQGELAE